MMAFVELEDLYGEVEVVVFPNVYERCAGAVFEDNVVVVKGKLNFKEEEMPKLLADSVVGINDVEEHLQPGGGRSDGYGRNGGVGNSGASGFGNGGAVGNGGNRGTESAGNQQRRPSHEPSPVKVRIPQEASEQEVLTQLQQIFRQYHGGTPVLIYLQNGKIVKTSPGSGVYPTIEFFDTVAEIVGRPNVKGRPIPNR